MLGSNQHKAAVSRKFFDSYIVRSNLIDVSIGADILFLEGHQILTELPQAHIPIQHIFPPTFSKTQRDARSSFRISRTQYLWMHYF